MTETVTPFFPPTFEQIYAIIPYQFPLADVQPVVRIPVAGPAPYNTLAIVRTRVFVTPWAVSDDTLIRQRVPVTTALRLAGYDPLRPEQQHVIHSSSATLRMMQITPQGGLFDDSNTDFVYAADDISGSSIDAQGNWVVTIDVACQVNMVFAGVYAEISSWVLCYEPPGTAAGQGTTPSPGIPADPAKFAEARQKLITQLISEQRLQQALALVPEAIAGYKQYAVMPGGDVMRAARDLAELTGQLTSLGQPPAAVDAAQAAADILGAVPAPVPPDAGFLGLRAEARHTLALRLIAAARMPEAVAPADLAAADYLALADLPGADKIGIARTLLTLCAEVTPASFQAAAVDAAQAAADILGTIPAPVPPDAGFLELRADARHTLALRLIAAARIPEAVAPAELAVTDYVSLASISDVHQVVVSLQNLSRALLAAGLDAAALDAQQAAMRLAPG